MDSLLSFPSWWLSVICRGRNVCVCACVCACACAWQWGMASRRGKKSLRNFSYRWRQICSENTKYEFLTYFVPSFSHIAHFNGHQNETFCQPQLVKMLGHARAIRSHFNSWVQQLRWELHSQFWSFFSIRRSHIPYRCGILFEGKMTFAHIPITFGDVI